MTAMRSSRAPYALVARENIKLIHTLRAGTERERPMERWVGGVRRECLDKILIVGRGQLEHGVCVRQDNRRRPHRALGLRPPDASTGPSVRTEPKPRDLQLRRRDLLGGLTHEYEIHSGVTIESLCTPRADQVADSWLGPRRHR